MYTDKGNLIYLIYILREYSDEEHILSMSDILSKMNSLYGVNPDRRTIYSLMDMLISLGYDISTYRENKQGYYLRQREFEASEIRMLTDAVLSFPFIPEQHTRELVKKLQSFGSVYRRKKYSYVALIREDNKSRNPQVFLNIELLEEAIEAGRQVSFTYLSYDVDKNLVPRRDRPYTVEPYIMVYTNERYYLLCRLAGHDNISLYRVDRIKDINILDIPIENSPPENISDTVKNALYAFTGTPQRLVFAFDKNQLNNVIDRFGRDIEISDEGERYICRTVANYVGASIWALQYLPYVEILEPEELRNEIKDIINNNYYNK